MQSEIGTLRREMQSEIGTLRREMQSGFEAMRNELGGLRSEMQALRQDMHGFQQTTTRQMRTMMSVVTAVMLGGLLKWVFFPG